MRKVLVTGATGFIGKHVIPVLLDRGYEVVATSRTINTAKSLSWYERVKFIPFDFADINPVEDYFSFFEKPDFVIHLAWEGLPNYREPFHINVNLPRHTLFIRNLIQNGLRDISIAGTCFEYGMQEGKLSEEMHAMPANPYAIAKDELRKEVDKMNVDFSFSFKWIRLFYMYGDGQHPKSLFSQLKQAIADKQTSFNMSPGDQLRDFLDIETVANNIVAIAVQNEVEGIINCCSGIPISVQEFVESYLHRVNIQLKLNLGHYPYSDLEPKNFWGDNAKLKLILQK